jgi:anthranilate phosphoribosyltransferase
VKEGPLRDIAGGDRAHNAKIILEILYGKEGTPRDMALINAAAALKMTGRAEGFQEGVKIAAESIDSGRAREKLNSLRKKSNR